MVDFWVGQKVVCVNAKPLRPGHTVNGLTEGTVYTIREIFTLPQWYIDWHRVRGATLGKVHLRLEEIRRPINTRLRVEYGYSPKRFRPLIQTDISVFTAMLAPQPGAPEKVE